MTSKVSSKLVLLLDLYSTNFSPPAAGLKLEFFQSIRLPPAFILPWNQNIRPLLLKVAKRPNIEKKNAFTWKHWIKNQFFRNSVQRSFCNSKPKRHFKSLVIRFNVHSGICGTFRVRRSQYSDSECHEVIRRNGQCSSHARKRKSFENRRFVAFINAHKFD